MSEDKKPPSKFQIFDFSQKSGGQIYAYHYKTFNFNGKTIE